jgi:hypothetical protein
MKSNDLKSGWPNISDIYGALMDGPFMTVCETPMIK